MEVLSSRILLHPSELQRSHRFYRDMLGLAIYRQFGTEDAPGLVFFLGNGLLEVSGQSADALGDRMAIWIQVLTYRPSMDDCFALAYRYSASHGRRRGGWWRCGLRIRTACESSWSRSQRIIRCDGTSGPSRCSMNKLS